MKNQLLDLSFHIRHKDRRIREITNQTRREVRNESNLTRSHKANLQKIMDAMYNLPQEKQAEFIKLKSLVDDSPRPKENHLETLAKSRDISENFKKALGVSEIPYRKYVETPEYYYSLFVSDAKTANDFVELQKFNIYAVLTFGKSNDPSKFTGLKGGYLCLNLEDSSKGLIPLMETICKFIDLHITKGNILVHCCQGNSRSCAATIGYLIKKFRIPLDQCLNIVKEGRPSVEIAHSFERQLTRIERAELYN